MDHRPDAPLNCLSETISQHPALRHGVEALEAGGHGLQAMQIVAWYRLRWIIERVLRTMKTDGVDVETSQSTTPLSLAKLVTVALIAAIRVMQLVIGHNGSIRQSVRARRTRLNCQPYERSAPPSKDAPRSSKTRLIPPLWLGYASIAARLGGWSGYTSKGYRPPGPRRSASNICQIVRASGANSPPPRHNTLKSQVLGCPPPPLCVQQLSKSGVALSD
jgi:hypothetical protein